jgi:excisionase family DNA binding protein
MQVKKETRGQSTPATPSIARLTLVTRKEAADVMAVSIMHIDRMIKRGDLDIVRIGPRGVRIKVMSLRRYLDE